MSLLVLIVTLFAMVTQKKLQLIKHFSSIYFTKILGYCLMGNHFHVVVRMHPSEKYFDDDISNRYALYYQNDKTKNTPLPGQVPMLREKWQNLSEFMKEIKQSFSRFYNKKHHRRDFFWSERFKSVLVENCKMRDRPRFIPCCVTTSLTIQSNWGQILAPR